jgi:hypothetical protein
MSNQLPENLNHTFDLDPPFFDDAKKIQTKITLQGGVEHDYKMEMPPCGVGLDLMTRHIHEFTGRIQALEIPDIHGGARFSLFRNSLHGRTSTAPMTGWLEVNTGQLNVPLTRAHFTKIGRAWIARAATTTERADQIIWMRTVKKEPSTTVEQFESNLLLTNQLTEWLPGNSPVLNADEIKNTFFNGMPIKWKSAYRAANLNANTDTFNSILSYMRTCEKESNNKAKYNLLKQQQTNSRSDYNQGRFQASGG